MFLSDELQLGYALEAFGYAFGLGPFWASQFFLYFTKAGITSMSDLATGSRDETVNMDLEFIGVTEKVSEPTMKQLYIFLPGPMGHRCFRLAQRAAEKVKAGEADAKYVHRPEDGNKRGEERFSVNPQGEWTLHVDCAGFVRSVLQHVTKDPFLLALSDRIFMRAKDYYRFFETVPYDVTGKELMKEKEMCMQWRVVLDLRMVIPGDIIVWRPKGNAAGGAAFTTNDRSDLRHLLKAVKTSELWHDEEGEWKNLVTRNVGRDPSVKPWVDQTRVKLGKVGITSVKELRQSFGTINDTLKEKGEEPLKESTLQLMKECAYTSAMNTGHIVFASGPAELKGENEYRIRVVHSTQYGVTDRKGRTTEGVQEYFRRFRLVTDEDGNEKWTRDMKVEEVSDDGDTDDNDEDDDDDDPDDVDENPVDREMEAPGDELAGAVDVEVLAARMCF